MLVSNSIKSIFFSYTVKFRSTALIFTSWIISIMFGIFGAVTQNDSQLWLLCIKIHHAAQPEDNSTHMNIFNTMFALIYFMVVILAPFIAICVIYICIYAAARKNSERMRQSTKANSLCSINSYMQIPNNKAPSESRLDLETNTKEKDEKEAEASSSISALPNVQSAPNFSNLIQLQEELKIKNEVQPQRQVKRASSERVGFITNLKYKLSNASVFRYREETRAAKISILVIFMVLVCYIPYGLAVILNSHIVGMTTPFFYNFISLVLLIISNIISPFLFAEENTWIFLSMCLL